MLIYFSTMLNIFMKLRTYKNIKDANFKKACFNFHQIYWMFLNIIIIFNESVWKRLFNTLKNVKWHKIWRKNTVSLPRFQPRYMHYEPITTDFILHQKVKAIKAYVIGKNTNLFVFYNIKYNDVFLEQLRMFREGFVRFNDK